MTLRPAPPDAEIGRTPHRDRSTSASRAVVVQCVVVSRLSRASPLWVGSTGARVCQGRSVDVAHSCALRVSRNPGIMRNSNVSSNHALTSHVRSPPLTAHGSPTTTHHDHQKSPSFQQKTSPTPQSTQPPKTTTPTTPRVEIGPVGSSSIITTRNPPKSSGFGTNGLKRLSLSQGEGWNHAVLCRGADGSDPACPES